MFGSELAVVMGSWRGKLFYRLLGHEHIGLRCRAMHIKKALRGMTEPKIRHTLDAGTGDGCYAFYLARFWPHAQVTAVDVDAAKIAQGQNVQKRLAFPNITFVNERLESLSGQNRFDLIICVDVLEHIDEDSLVIHNFRSLLNPGGTLLLHVPNVQQRHRYVEGGGQRERRMGHVRTGYEQDGLKAELERAGLEVNCTKHTFGTFGAMASDLSLATKHSSFLTLLLFPFLLLLCYLDTRWPNRVGNGLLFIVARGNSA